MTEDYVSFEQAKLLKEKGFPQPDTIKGNLFYCEMPFTENFGYSKIVKYNEGELLSDENLDEKDFQKHSIMFFDYCPTLSLVQKWLREEKDIEVLEFIHLVPNEPSYNIYNKDKRWVYKVDNMLYKRYERALSTVINKVLEII